MNIEFDKEIGLFEKWRLRKYFFLLFLIISAHKVKEILHPSEWDLKQPKLKEITSLVSVFNKINFFFSCLALYTLLLLHKELFEKNTFGEDFSILEMLVNRVIQKYPSGMFT